jgi:alpha-1,2-mannosyltransferase
VVPVRFAALLVGRFRRLEAVSRRRARAGFLAAMAVGLVVTSLVYVGKVSKPGDSGQQSRSAFLRWRAMIRDVFAGANIYVGVNEYPNPPVMAIVLRPFAELPPVAGALAWFYAKAAVTVLAARWFFRLLQPAEGGTGEGMSDPAKAAAILLALPPVIGDLTHNNVNLFILFLLAATLELYRSGREWPAGVVLGLAIACKVTPLLFLAYFVWKQAGRVVAGCALGLVLWLFLVPGAVLGWSHNQQLLTDWYHLMVERPVLKGEVTTEHANQALPGTIYRLLTHSPSYIDYLDLGPAGKFPTPAAYHNLCDIGRPAAWLLVKALTLGFAVLVVSLCRTHRADRQGYRFAAECGLILLGMLLLSERTWKHHAVTLMLPAAVLAHAASRGASKLWGGLIASGALMTLPGLFGTRGGDLGLIYGSHTLAFLLLGGGVCWVLRDALCGLDGTNGRDNPPGQPNPG